MRSQGDHIYINSKLYNSTNQPIVCEYKETFSQSIVPKGNDFYLTVVRFEIPNSVPIFEFKDNYYNLTLSYNGSDYTQYLQMQNVDTPASNSVYTFQQMVDIINTAFDSAHQALITDNPAAPDDPPYLTFDPVTDLFSLFIPQTYDGVVETFFNYNLYAFFQSSFHVFNLGVGLPNHKDFRFIIHDSNPVGDYYEIKQQLPTLYNFYDFESIVFSSNALPVRTEFITAKDSGGKSIQQAIITDFIPQLGKDRSNFIYDANPYRLVDCLGNSDIKKFDFRVFYINRDGLVKPIMIPPGKGMSVKFLFVRK